MNKRFAPAATTVLALVCSPPPDAPAVEVVPAPAVVNPGRGVFEIDSSTRFVVVGPDRARLEELAGLGADFLATSLQVTHAIGDEGQRNAIRLVLDSAISIAAEGYSLQVSRRGVEITATTYAGLFYGVQTLRQLVVSNTGSSGTFATVPSVSIEDRPRFPYRGVHLDVGRHLFPVAFIKKYIDLMAAYKFNRFHGI